MSSLAHPGGAGISPAATTHVDSSPLIAKCPLRFTDVFPWTPNARAHPRATQPTVGCSALFGGQLSPLTSETIPVLLDGYSHGRVEPPRERIPNVRFVGLMGKHEWFDRAYEEFFRCTLPIVRLLE